MNPLARALLGHDPICMTAGERAMHTHVIGQPGTGKSRALESWALQDMLAGRGVTVIDPHGDLYGHLVAHLALRPALWSRVVLVDPCDPKWTVGFNPLEAVPGLSQERLALFLTDMVVKVWKLDPASSPRLVWLLTNTFLALLDLGLSLLELPRFLLDAAYRQRLLPRLSHEAVRAYFAYEFPQSQAASHQWVTPLLNKLGGLLFDRDVRLMLAARPSLNFRAVLDERRILLVHLPKGTLGEGTSALVGAFLVAHLQKAALSRANTPERVPHTLYLDEFQNYTTDNLQDILSESRKYGLSLILAHQYLDQLAPELQSAVLNTAGALVCFRVGYQDAVQLAKVLFPSPDFLTRSEARLRLRRLWGLPLLTLEAGERALRWEGLAQMLASLPPREFWVRQRGHPAPVRARTLTMEAPPATAELSEQVRRLRDATGARTGQLKAQVRQALARHAWDPAPPVAGQGGGMWEEVPGWGQ